jgi:hypothetical protein
MAQTLTAALLTAALLMPATAEARWPNGSGSRLRLDHDVFESAAEAFGMSPAEGVLLAAICTHETGHRGVRGGKRNEMWGACQVHWKSWAADLRESGVADKPEDLLDRPVGVLAGALVLSEIRRRYPGSTLRQQVCLYACGEKAEAWSSCGYADEVFDNVPRAAGELLRGKLAGLVAWLVEAVRWR